MGYLIGIESYVVGRINCCVFWGINILFFWKYWDFYFDYMKKLKEVYDVIKSRVNLNF